MIIYFLCGAVSFAIMQSIMNLSKIYKLNDEGIELDDKIFGLRMDLNENYRTLILRIQNLEVMVDKLLHEKNKESI